MIELCVCLVSYMYINIGPLVPIVLYGPPPPPPPPPPFPPSACYIHTELFLHNMKFQMRLLLLSLSFTCSCPAMVPSNCSCPCLQVLPVSWLSQCLGFQTHLKQRMADDPFLIILLSFFVVLLRHLSAFHPLVSLMKMSSL